MEGEGKNLENFSPLLPYHLVMRLATSRATIEAGLCHAGRIEDAIEFGVRELCLLAGHLTYRLASFIGHLRDISRRIVANDRGQRRTDSQTALDHLRALCGCL